MISGIAMRSTFDMSKLSCLYQSSSIVMVYLCLLALGSKYLGSILKFGPKTVERQSYTAESVFPVS